MGTQMGVGVPRGARKVYHACNTGVFLDMLLFGELYRPLDVALLPIGDNFTMGIDDAVKAAEMIGAETVIPMHYNTWEVIEQDPLKFRETLEEETGIKCTVMAPGEAIEF